MNRLSGHGPMRLREFVRLLKTRRSDLPDRLRKMGIRTGSLTVAAQ